MAATNTHEWGKATSGDSIGPYRLAEVLGEGGMGVVRRGIDPAGRSVAVKLLRGGTGDVVALRRLAREVDTMRRVRSPYVAQIVDADVTADPPYIVTQYVKGRTLEQTIAEKGVLTGTALKQLAEGLAEALAAIHSAGIVHRDLKPGNVMFAENGDPILIDFGIAQPVDATRLTSAGMVIGTPGYLSPEIINGEDFRAPADVHAWAGTLIFGATGRPPFGTGTFESIFYKIMQGTPDLNGVPAPLLPVLRSAMAQHPAERPTARDLAYLISRIDLEMTMIDHTMLDGPSQPISLQTPGHPRNVSEARPVQEIPRQPSNESRRQPMAQPRDFVGQLPPVAPPPAPPPNLYAPEPRRPANDRPRSTVNDRHQPSRGYAPPPVQQPPWAPPNTQPPQQYGQQTSERQPTSERRTDEQSRKPYGLYKVLSLLLLAAALGLTWAVPVTALGVVLVAAVVLRAGDRAAKGLESRRVRRGERSSDLALTLLKTPLHLPRAILTTALVTPIGLFLGSGLLIALLAAQQDLSAYRAVAISMLAVVVLQFVGPGGTATRRQLARVWGGLLPRADMAAIAALCLAAGVGVLLMMVYKQDPDLTPIDGFADKLESWRSTVKGWVNG